MPTYYPINEEAARRAKEMNSFHDYRPGSATEEYRQSVDQASAIASAQKARVDPMYHEKIDRLLDLYARKLAENLNQSYDIAARCPSILIAGPASFPARKKEKQNRSADANMAEWRSIQGILDKIRGTGMRNCSKRSTRRWTTTRDGCRASPVMRSTTAQRKSPPWDSAITS